MGFLFSIASEVYFEEAEGNKKPTREAGYGFYACPGSPIWDAQSRDFGSSESHSQKPTREAGYGFYACPGLPFGMHNPETSGAVNPFP
ncbi:hypothetical protein [Sediminicola sp. 1XM1-17]|uniref:hypothetical protein n=1 Tax=Sediminicola sp. 1XM1-17 TaxID=3127702 RepID=UPI003077E5ED